MSQHQLGNGLGMGNQLEPTSAALQMNQNQNQMIDASINNYSKVEDAPMG